MDFHLPRHLPPLSWISLCVRGLAAGAQMKGSEYQRVPGSDRADFSPVKRQRSSPPSSNSSTRTAHRRNSRAAVKSRSATTKTLKMAELLSIKRELTVIKVQIDELLDCVDKMDRQRKDCTDCPVSREASVVLSPHRGSVSSLDQDSPEPGEASEEEPVYYQHYYTQTYSHRILSKAAERKVRYREQNGSIGGGCRVVPDQQSKTVSLICVKPKEQREAGLVITVREEEDSPAFFRPRGRPVMSHNRSPERTLTIIILRMAPPTIHNNFLFLLTTFSHLKI
ncbi:hypothetical protein WMY93_023047 [Mugilogobius chulae]|uniref:Uncharacterized protein n=1 Tax=Mugilogobius chulae TaxID=88201 RepID=A0AAW0NFL4_9GOBI